MARTMHHVDRFAASMPRLEAIAYRLLGSASDAEDAVQDTSPRPLGLSGNPHTRTASVLIPHVWTRPTT